MATQITSIALATASGTEMARDILHDIACNSTLDEPDALYEIVDKLTVRKSGIDDAVLKALLNRMQKQLECAMRSTTTPTQSDAPIALARSIGYGCVSEWFHRGDNQLPSASIGAWRARWYADFVREFKNRDDFLQLLDVWEQAFDSKLHEYEKRRDEERPDDYIRSLVAWDQLHAAPPHQQPALSPSATHKPFSWLDDQLTHDQGAQFVALTMDVCQGVQTCLELVHSSNLDRTQNSNEIPALLDLGCTERLLRFAKVSARMLADAAEERIEWLNEYGIKERK